MSALTETPTQRFAAYKAVVHRGIDTFVDVGNALLGIRNERLYRLDGFPTFEKFCQAEFHFSRQRASQLIEAAHVAEVLRDGDDEMSTTVDNEWQARALAPLVDDPETARQVWSEVYDETDGAPTARAIRDRVQSHYGGQISPKPIRVNVVQFGQILEWQPEEVAHALPDDQIEGQITEAEAAREWLTTYISVLTSRRS